jgi:hypothetical protein
MGVIAGLVTTLTLTTGCITTLLGTAVGAGIGAIAAAEAGVAIGAGAGAIAGALVGVYEDARHDQRRQQCTRISTETREVVVESEWRIDDPPPNIVYEVDGESYEDYLEWKRQRRATADACISSDPDDDSD